MGEKVIKGWNKFEIIWLTVFSAVAIMLSILWKDNVFSLSIFISGVLCVVLAAKGNIWTYYFGMYNTIAYAWLSFQNGLYGETMLNAIFFVPMSVIGWVSWRKKMNNNTVIMRKMSWKTFGISVLICLVGTVGLGYFLSTLNNQNTAYIDAFTNCTSIIATIIMTLRYREQWIFYISINIFSIIMWTFRLTNGSDGAATMVVMWSAYLVNSIYGLYVWNKGYKAMSREKPAAELAV